MARSGIVYIVTLGELAEVPGSPFAYWALKNLRELFRKFPPLDRDVARRPDQPKIADVKVGRSLRQISYRGYKSIYFITLLSRSGG